MIIAKEKQTAIIKAATDNNFYGKRLRSVKLELCEQISRDLYGTGQHAANICDWLEENRPVKEVAPKQPKASRPLVDLPVEAGTLEDSTSRWPVLAGKCFILTSAQNNTTPHVNFLESLKKYAEFRNGTLLISKFLYNKNGFQNGEGQKGIKFNEALEPYFIEENVFLNNRSFAFMAELNIIPTATYPLSGFAEIIGQYSAAVGHAQITAENVPALKGQQVRRLFSTGTVTQRNYIQQKAGQKAEGLHCFGALLVEFAEDGTFFTRQLQAMDSTGQFYDLNYKITPQGVETTSGHIAALQYGDIHAEKADEDCVNASFGSNDSLLDFLRPRYQFVHDVHDFTSRNHHNRMSGVFLARQYAAGRDKVIDDLRDTGRMLQLMERDYSQTVVVESNHDLALSRWLDDPKVKIGQDPANAKLYHALNAALYTAIENKDDTFNMLDYALRKFGGYDFNATFLVTDQSFPVAGVEMGMHGDKGINGSRGTPKQFKKLGIKANTGHTHSASIYGGVYTAGVTGALDMGYNEGASSWSQTHIITYENGQRTLIDYKNGEFFAL